MGSAKNESVYRGGPKRWYGYVAVCCTTQSVALQSALSVNLRHPGQPYRPSGFALLAPRWPPTLPVISQRLCKAAPKAALQASPSQSWQTLDASLAHVPFCCFCVSVSGSPLVFRIRARNAVGWGKYGSEARPCGAFRALVWVLVLQFRFQVVFK